MNELSILRRTWNNPNLNNTSMKTNTILTAILICFSVSLHSQTESTIFSSEKQNFTDLKTTKNDLAVNNVQEFCLTSTETGPYEVDKNYFNRCYKGQQVQSLWGQDGSIEINACITLHSDLTIGGTWSSTITIDKRRYTSKSYITGKYDSDNHELTIYNGSTISEDKLPGDLYWIKDGYSTGKLYKNSDHPGYYIIKGKHSKTGNTFEIADY